MKTIIFMNHRIRDKEPEGGVIRVQKGRSRKDTNEARLMIGGRQIGRVVYDPPNNPVTSHDIKAWVELDEGIEVMT